MVRRDGGSKAPITQTASLEANRQQLVKHPRPLRCLWTCHLRLLEAHASQASPGRSSTSRCPHLHPSSHHRFAVCTPVPGSAWKRARVAAPTLSDRRLPRESVTGMSALHGLAPRQGRLLLRCTAGKLLARSAVPFCPSASQQNKLSLPCCHPLLLPMPSMFLRLA
jgi:hypothetical protein